MKGKLLSQLRAFTRAYNSIVAVSDSDVNELVALVAVKASNATLVAGSH